MSSASSAVDVPDAAAPPPARSYATPFYLSPHSVAFTTTRVQLASGSVRVAYDGTPIVQTRVEDEGTDSGTHAASHFSKRSITTPLTLKQPIMRSEASPEQSAGLDHALSAASAATAAASSAGAIVHRAKPPAPQQPYIFLRTSGSVGTARDAKRKSLFAERVPQHPPPSFAMGDWRAAEPAPAHAAASTGLKRSIVLRPSTSPHVAPVAPSSAREEEKTAHPHSSFLSSPPSSAPMARIVLRRPATGVTPLSATADASAFERFATPASQQRPHTSANIVEHFPPPPAVEPLAAPRNAIVLRPHSRPSAASVAATAEQQAAAAAVLAARIQQTAILLAQRLVSPPEPDPATVAPSNPASGSLKFVRRRGVALTGRGARKDSAATAAASATMQGGHRGSVLMRADDLAQLASRSKGSASDADHAAGADAGMSFRHSFLFTGNHRMIEQALKRKAEAAAAAGEHSTKPSAGGKDGSDSDSDDEGTGEDIRPELIAALGFAQRRSGGVGSGDASSTAPALHPGTMNLWALDAATIAADHAALHAHLARPDALDFPASEDQGKDLEVVESWLTEMALKFQRKMEGGADGSIGGAGPSNGSRGGGASGDNHADAAALRSSEMALDTAGGSYQSPLDRLSLGRRLLLKAGMDDALASRCYKAFFTYSVGIYDTLLGMIKHVSQRKALLSLVWRSYLANLEHAEPQLYSWGLECLRTENARREDLRRQEHQHRVRLLKLHVTRLRKKVDVMSLNDTGLTAIQAEEILALNSLGTDLRRMQHEYELGTERKANWHAKIAEWTINSFETEGQVSDVHGELQQLHASRKQLHVDIAALKRRLQIHDASLLEARAKQNALEHETKSLDKELQKIESSMAQSLQDGQSERENCLHFQKLLREEISRVYELEDALVAQQAFLDFLASRAVQNMDLTEAAQEEMLRRMLVEASRTRINRAAVAAVASTKQTTPTPRRAAAPVHSSSLSSSHVPAPAPSVSPALHAPLPELEEFPDDPLAGFDPSTGAMSPAEEKRRGMGPLRIDTEKLQKESALKTKEFQLQAKLLTEEVAMEKVLVAESQSRVSLVRTEHADLSQAREARSTELRELQARHAQLVGTSVASLRSQIAAADQAIAQAHSKRDERTKELQQKRAELAEVLEKIADLGVLEQKRTEEISAQNTEQSSLLTHRSALEHSITARAKTLSKKARHLELLEEEAFPALSLLRDKLKIMQTELQLHQGEEAIHERMMLSEAKRVAEKESVVSELQKRVEEEKEKYRVALERTNELNRQIESDVACSAEHRADIASSLASLESESVELDRWEKHHSLPALSLLEQERAQATATLALHTQRDEEAVAELGAARALGERMAESHAQRVSDREKTLRIKRLDAQEKKRQFSLQRIAVDTASGSLRAQLAEAEELLAQTESSNEAFSQRLTAEEERAAQAESIQRSRAAELESERATSVQLQNLHPYLLMQQEQINNERRSAARAIQEAIQVEQAKSKLLQSEVDVFLEREEAKALLQSPFGCQAGEPDPHGLFESLLIQEDLDRVWGGKIIVPTIGLDVPAIRDRLKHVRRMHPPLTQQLQADGNEAARAREAEEAFDALPRRHMPKGRKIASDHVHPNGTKSVRVASPTQVAPIDLTRSISDPVLSLRSHDSAQSGSEDEFTEYGSDDVVWGEDESSESEHGSGDETSLVDTALFSETTEPFDSVASTSSSADAVAPFEYVLLTEGQEVSLVQGDELVEESTGAENTVSPASARRFLRRRTQVNEAGEPLVPLSDVRPMSTHVKVTRFEPAFFAPATTKDGKNAAATASIRLHAPTETHRSSFSILPPPKFAPGALFHGDHPAIEAAARRPSAMGGAGLGLLPLPSSSTRKHRRPSSIVAREMGVADDDVIVAKDDTPSDTPADLPSRMIKIVIPPPSGESIVEATTPGGSIVAAAAPPLKPYFVVSPYAKPKTRKGSVAAGTGGTSRSRRPSTIAGTVAPPRHLAGVQAKVQTHRPSVSSAAHGAADNLHAIHHPQPRTQQSERDRVLAAIFGNSPASSPGPDPSVRARGSRIVVTQKARPDNEHIAGFREQAKAQRLALRLIGWRERQEARMERRMARAEAARLTGTTEEGSSSASEDDFTEPEPTLSSDDDEEAMAAEAAAIDREYEGVLNPVWKKSFSPDLTKRASWHDPNRASLHADQPDEFIYEGKSCSVRSILDGIAASSVADAAARARAHAKEQARMARAKRKAAQGDVHALVGLLATNENSIAAQQWNEALQKHENTVAQREEEAQKANVSAEVANQVLPIDASSTAETKAEEPSQANNDVGASPTGDRADGQPEHSSPRSKRRKSTALRGRKSGAESDDASAVGASPRAPRRSTAAGAAPAAAGTDGHTKTPTTSTRNIASEQPRPAHSRRPSLGSPRFSKRSELGAVGMQNSSNRSSIAEGGNTSRRASHKRRSSKAAALETASGEPQTPQGSDTADGERAEAATEGESPLAQLQYSDEDAGGEEGSVVDAATAEAAVAQTGHSAAPSVPVSAAATPSTMPRSILRMSVPSSDASGSAVTSPRVSPRSGARFGGFSASQSAAESKRSSGASVAATASTTSILKLRSGAPTPDAASPASSPATSAVTSPTARSRTVQFAPADAAPVRAPPQPLQPRLPVHPKEVTDATIARMNPAAWRSLAQSKRGSAGDLEAPEVPSSFRRAMTPETAVRSAAGVNIKRASRPRKAVPAARKAVGSPPKPSTQLDSFVQTQSPPCHSTSPGRAAGVPGQQTSSAALSSTLPVIGWSGSRPSSAHRSAVSSSQSTSPARSVAAESGTHRALPPVHPSATNAPAQAAWARHNARVLQSSPAARIATEAVQATSLSAPAPPPQHRPAEIGAPHAFQTLGLAEQSPSALILFDDNFFQRTHADAVEAAARQTAALALAREPAPPSSAAPFARPGSRSRSRTVSRSASRSDMRADDDRADSGSPSRTLAWSAAGGVDGMQVAGLGAALADGVDSAMRDTGADPDASLHVSERSYEIARGTGPRSQRGLAAAPATFVPPLDVSAALPGSQSARPSHSSASSRPATSWQSAHPVSWPVALANLSASASARPRTTSAAPFRPRTSAGMSLSARGAPPRRRSQVSGPLAGVLVPDFIKRSTYMRGAAADA